MSLNIRIPGDDSSTFLCETDKSGRSAPTKRIITKSTYATTPSTDPFREKELQESHSPNQPISDPWPTKLPCKKKEVEFQDDTSLCSKNYATCRKNKPYPDKNQKSNLPQHPWFTIDPPAWRHERSRMITGSKLSELRNIANWQAHYAFTAQGKLTTANKEDNKASPSISPAVKFEALASARKPSGMERRPTQSRMKRFGNFSLSLSIQHSDNSLCRPS